MQKIKLSRHSPAAFLVAQFSAYGGGVMGLLQTVLVISLICLGVIIRGLLERYTDSRWFNHG